MNVQTRFVGLISTVAAGAESMLPSRRTSRRQRHSHGMGHAYDMVSCDCRLFKLILIADHIFRTSHSFFLMVRHPISIFFELELNRSDKLKKIMQCNEYSLMNINLMNKLV